MDLSVLRWMYNGTVDIADSYLSNDNNNTQKCTSNPAFISVVLVAVSRSHLNPAFGNFFSILTVNLSLLEHRNITEISCGDPLIKDTVPVDVQILQETVPETPKFLSATLLESLTLEILWQAMYPVVSDHECVDYISRLMFTITVKWNKINHSATVNGSICQASRSVCSTAFNVSIAIEKLSENLTVHLQANNSLGASNISTDIVALCGVPLPPINGSSNNTIQAPFYLVGSNITYHCDDELLPTGVMTSTCTDVGGRGEWVPDPAQLVCKEKIDNYNVLYEVKCNTDELPENKPLLYYSLMGNSSVGSTVTFTCNKESELSGPTTITCNSSGQWTSDPSVINCSVSESAVLTPYIAASAGGCLVAVLGVVILGVTGRIICSKKSKEKLALDSTKNFDDIYNRLSHQNYEKKLMMKDSDLDTDPGSVYSTIADKEVKPVIYTEVATDCLRPKSDKYFSSSVNYSTVDTEASEKRAVTMLCRTDEENLHGESHFTTVDKLLDLNQCLVQLKSIYGRWKEVGKALSTPSTYIEQVETYCASSSDVAAGLTEIIDFWLRNCDGQPTWRELAHAVKLVGEIELAEQLISVYDTGHLPTMLNFEAIPDNFFRHDTSPPPPLPPRSGL